MISNESLFASCINEFESRDAPVLLCGITFRGWFGILDVSKSTGVRAEIFSNGATSESLEEFKEACAGLSGERGG